MDTASLDIKPETMVTTIEIQKELFLKFKALCVLNEERISGEIARLMRKHLDDLGNPLPAPVSV